MIDAGTVLQNRYLIEKQIGQGGMGTVYIATDQRFNSLVAIKETIFTDAGLLRAFEREAQLLNSLRHPALPRVSDFFTEGDNHFLVMEYIAGEDLAATLDRKAAIPIQDVLLWADQLLDALDYLHSQKMSVVHRDIKPQNLKLMSRNQIILLDFGLAKGKAGDVTQVSQTKSVFGYSRAYAPLEQIQGTGTDPRSDLYSLAATVYHLLTGTAPIDALTRATAVLNNSNDPLKPADALNSEVPAAVASVLQTAMSLNANLRPESAAAMREALNQAVTNPEAFVASEAAAGGANLFSQNTQLINEADAVIINQNSEAKDVEATQYSGNSLEKVNFDTNPQKTGQKTVLDASEHPVPAAPGFQVRVAGETIQPAIFSEPVQPEPRRSSLLMPLGVAAAIAVLAGGGLATWYATGGASSSVNPQPTHNQSTIKVETNSSVAGETKSSNSAQPATETHNADKDATAKNPAQNAATTTTTQIRTTENSPVTERAEKPRTAPNESNPEEQQPADEEANDEQNQDDPPPPPVNVEDLRKVPEQIRERTKNLQRQKYEEAKRRIEEFNRKRAEQGLPTVDLPPPPQFMRDQREQ